ncbi:MAG: hypothetical protein JSW62_04085 [Thermoplasmatales archaeon]|nr:MAG: hypothetical protein JSW62_04085 [Thermoplasmatales archaeon]
MFKKIMVGLISFVLFFSLFCQFAVATSIPGQIYEGNINLIYRNVTVYAPAVAQTDDGYFGVISTITVTIQDNGSGRVFVDTLPLTQIDMQGSARLAVKVAGKLVEGDNITADDYDFFFVVRTSAPIIGGPSAGAVMAAAAVALLENWTIDNETVMTGMINPDGSIGPVGGIPQKIDAASSVGATRFLIPKGQGTYTEMATETTVENGWSRTYTYPVTRSVADYAMKNYGMEVIEVEDINEALMNFTGYGFLKEESSQKITTEDYIDSMKPLASSLLNESSELYKNASALLSNSTISNRYPFYYKNQIADIINDAEERLKESEKWYEQGLYYSSTSKSFQSIIDSRFVLYACEYFDSEDGDQYITSLIDEATSIYSNKSNEAKNAKINGMISLQCVGAAQKRVSEAYSYISDAVYSYDRNDYLTVLYKIAFSIERSNSVGWWLGLSSGFNDTGEINVTTLEILANEYIEDAQQSITYSSVILQEFGESSDYILSAEDLLSSARENLEDNYPAAALFESLEALVKANLAIENINDDAEEKIDRARESASNSISDSRNSGIEPVLAVSYYEYAESLVNESSFDSALVYYKYSDIIAGALGFTKFSGGKNSPSRYVGIPDTNASLWIFAFSSYINFILFTVSAFAIGIVGGMGLGLVIGNIILKKEEGKNKKPMARNIDYYKKQRKEYFHKDEIPKSIKDYYKKKQIMLTITSLCNEDMWRSYRQ